jgi:hypothetical protein
MIKTISILLISVFYVFGQNLITHLSFDNIDSTIAIDSVYNNHGQIIGAAPVQGILGDALHFDTHKGHVELGTLGWNLNTGSVLMWINRQMGYVGVENQYIFGHHFPDSTWNNKIQIYMKDDNDSLALGMGDDHHTNIAIAKIELYNWYHIALTWQNGVYNFYVDGEHKATGVYSNLFTLSPYIDIGNNGNSRSRNEYFGGYIDDVRIYDGTLTQIQIQTLIEVIPPAPLPPGLRTHLEHAKIIFNQEWTAPSSGLTIYSFQFRCLEFIDIDDSTYIESEYYNVILDVEIIDTLNVDSMIYQCQVKTQFIPGTDSLWKYNTKHTIVAKAVAVNLEGKSIYSSWSEQAIGYFMYGDFNSDWNVDGVDLIIFSPKFGKAVIELMYEDLNVDGWIDGIDLIIFSGFFGESWRP